MAGFPPARGAGSPFGAILGGLASGLQGFMQGRMLHDQEQQQQQDLQTSKLTNAMNVFKMLGQIGESDPAALSTPEMQQWVNQNAGNTIPIPRNAQGGIDVDAFRTPLSALTSDATSFEKFNQYDPGSPQRAQILASHGGTPQEKAALLNAPRVPTSAERDAAATNYRYYMNLISTGVDPRSLVPQINSVASVAGLPLMQITPDGKVVPIGGTAALGQSTKTTAQNNALNASANLHKAQQTLTDLRTKYFPRMQEAQIAKLLSSANLSDVEAKAIPQRVAIGWQNANTAANRANYEAQRLQMQLEDFQKLGDNTPQAVAAYSNLITAHQKQVQLDQTALNQVRSQMSNLLRNTLGNDPAANSASAKLLATYQKEEHNLSSRVQTETDALQKLQAGRSGFTQQVQTNILRSQGAPSNVRPVKTPNDSGPSFYPGSATKDGKPRWKWPDGSWKTSPPPKS